MKKGKEEDKKKRYIRRKIKNVKISKSNLEDFQHEINRRAEKQT